MPHNLVTESKQKLTHSKMGTQIAIPRITSSKIAICGLTSPVMQELSPFLSPNPIPIWELDMDTICQVESLQSQHAWISSSVLDWSL